MAFRFSRRLWGCAFPAPRGNHSFRAQRPLAFLELVQPLQAFLYSPSLFFLNTEVVAHLKTCQSPYQTGIGGQLSTHLQGLLCEDAPRSLQGGGPHAAARYPKSQNCWRRKGQGGTCSIAGTPLMRPQLPRPWILQPPSVHFERTHQAGRTNRDQQASLGASCPPRGAGAAITVSLQASLATNTSTRWKGLH